MEILLGRSGERGLHSFSSLVDRFCIPAPPLLELVIYASPQLRLGMHGQWGVGYSKSLDNSYNLPPVPMTPPSEQDELGMIPVHAGCLILLETLLRPGCLGASGSWKAGMGDTGGSIILCLLEQGDYSGRFDISRVRDASVGASHEVSSAIMIMVASRQPLRDDNRLTRSIFSNFPW